MVRRVKTIPDVEKILRQQRKRFAKKFGREPAPSDPIFFDSQANAPTSITEEQLRDATLKAMLAAGTPPQFVYVYQKTGLLVNETGYKNMSPEDRAEYDSAMDEYFAMEDAQVKRSKS